MTLFPLAAFDLIENAEADARLVEWGHWLGACQRPFGRQSFGLTVAGRLISVAVSASTPGARCGGFKRAEVVELARLCSSPRDLWATRVTLRLWRELAPRAWAATYWPVIACVSYQDAFRHCGDVYRFDGWRKIADTQGGRAGINTGWTRPRKDYAPKVVWMYDLRRNRA